MHCRYVYASSMVLQGRSAGSYEWSIGRTEAPLCGCARIMPGVYMLLCKEGNGDMSMRG